MNSKTQSVNLDQLNDYIKNNEIDLIKTYLKKIKKVSNEDLLILKNKALELASSSYFDIALSIYEFLLINTAEKSDLQFNIGLIHELKNNLTEALNFYNLSIQNNPKNFYALLNKSSILINLNRYEEADVEINKIFKIKQDLPEAWNNKGLVSKRSDQKFAQICFDRAIELNNNDHVAWYNKGLIYNSQNKFLDAIFCFNKVIQIDSNHFGAHFNIGIAFFQINAIQDSINHLKKAISVNTSSFESWLNLGLCYCVLKIPERALDCFENVLKINPNSGEAYANIAAIFQEGKFYSKALQYAKNARLLNENLNFLDGNILFLASMTVSWSDYEFFSHHILERIKIHSNVIQPMFFLPLSDSSELQLKISKDWSSIRYPNLNLKPNKFKYAHSKIRIGYFSSDFKHHPVSYLIIELLERHDRKVFEIYGISITPLSLDDTDPFLFRLKNSFDYLLDVSQDSDLSVVNLSRKYEIDIAVDLNGHTQDARTGIFAQRLAPIQINYLGFPGTMGTGYHDYLIADSKIIPSEQRSFYSEKIIFLPNHFQVFDTKRVIGTDLSRQKLGLPNNSFVFCCFNNTYKITPKIFNCWIKILKGVEDSVLWLLSDNSFAENNLRYEFIKYGLDPDRLVLCSRTNHFDYLTRFKAADLFLDTFPFNAGTTASDCLYAGIPILTYAGQSFASRMALSLLKACNLSDLITYSADEYVNRGIFLGNNPEYIFKYKTSLEALKNNNFWDITKQVEYIEKAYLKAFQQLNEANPFEDITIQL